MGITPPLGAIAGGIRYQVRFFWHQALPMLYGNAVAAVTMEHRGVGVVDDVVVQYANPGVNDRGSWVLTDYFQVKFHVAQGGAVDHAVVLDPAWTGTKEPLLKRLANAWRRANRQDASPRLTLVTNWPWNPKCPVARLLRDGGMLADDFFTRSNRSTAGRIRQEWKNACELDDAEFDAFGRSLRFSTSAVTQEQAEAWLQDRCQLAGLIPLDPSVDWSPYDDLGMRLLESGRTEHTPDSLRKLVEDQRLVQAPASVIKSTFAVRSFTRFAHEPATDASCVVDLTDLFDGRRVLSDDAWSGPIRARLEAAADHVARLSQPLYVALDAHLSIAWYAGYVLDPKAGVRVMLRQKVKNRGIELWEISTPRRPPGSQPWVRDVIEIGDGRDLGLVISVTHAVLGDAERHVRGSCASVGSLLHVRLPNLGSDAVRDGGHARWLADELIRIAAARVAEVRPERIHVFAAVPASLAFLLGQEARALGPTTVYEFEFGDARRRYRAGMATAAER